MIDPQNNSTVVMATIRLALIAIGSMLLVFAGATLAAFPPMGLFAALIGISGIRLIASGLTNKWTAQGGWVSRIIWRLIMVLAIIGVVARLSENKLQQEAQE